MDNCLLSDRFTGDNLPTMDSPLARCWLCVRRVHLSDKCDIPPVHQTGTFRLVVAVPPLDFLTIFLRQRGTVIEMEHVDRKLTATVYLKSGSLVIVRLPLIRMF